MAHRRRKFRPPKIINRSMWKKHGLYGQYDDEKHEVYIEPDLSNKEYFKTLVHEMFHVVRPEMTEREVIKATRMMFGVLWSQNYRKVLP